MNESIPCLSTHIHSSSHSPPHAPLPIIPLFICPLLFHSTHAVSKPISLPSTSPSLTSTPSRPIPSSIPTSHSILPLPPLPSHPSTLPSPIFLSLDSLLSHCAGGIR